MFVGPTKSVCQHRPFLLQSQNSVQFVKGKSFLFKFGMRSLAVLPSLDGIVHAKPGFSFYHRSEFTGHCIIPGYIHSCTHAYIIYLLEQASVSRQDKTGENPPAI